MLEKARRSVRSGKGGPQGIFYSYWIWIRNFGFIAIVFTLFFIALKFLVEITTGESFYVTVKSVDLIVYLQILILSLIVEARLHQMDIKSRL